MTPNLDVSATSTNYPRAGWVGTIGDFLGADPSSVLTGLIDHHRRAMNCEADDSQVTAWKDCLQTLGDQLGPLASFVPATLDWGLVLEYQLPRERGRRPDVLLITEHKLWVLEFKGHRNYTQAHIDQVRAYARDLKHYQQATHDRICLPVLVNASTAKSGQEVGGAWVIPQQHLCTWLRGQAEDHTETARDLEYWMSAEYAPLPSLVSAARQIFNHEPLPSIRQAKSAGIPAALAELVAIAQRARQDKTKHLALVTGVPGAGKTLVGLQLVYTQHFEAGDDERQAVFLSGNGPLVQVLQHALKSTVFVQDVHGFLKEYGGKADLLPDEHIWVYDEAQRAWDANRVGEKRGHPISEPEDFLRLGTRMEDWAMVVGLIGEGQEIHIGEEAGLAQWNDAIKATGGDWIVHCPTRVASNFPDAKHTERADKLDLSTTLRSHLAKDLQTWVSHVLGGRLADAHTIARQVRRDGFDLYATRDIEEAFIYAGQRYQEMLDKRFGLMASSKAKNLPRFGIKNDYAFTKRVRVGPWYNDPPTSRFSCCQLHDVVTEFSCQGLELDLPIVAWGSDLTWAENHWKSPPQPRSSARDPHRLRINSYRVLLTRGRDGMVIYVPLEEQMDSTFSALIEAGVNRLG